MLVHQPSCGLDVARQHEAVQVVPADVLPDAACAQQEPDDENGGERRDAEVPERPAHQSTFGASKPPHTPARCLARSTVVRSSRYGPTICNPTGKPLRVRPTGA